MLCYPVFGWVVTFTPHVQVIYSRRNLLVSSMSQFIGSVPMSLVGGGEVLHAAFSVVTLDICVPILIKCGVAVRFLPVLVIFCALSLVWSCVKRVSWVAVATTCGGVVGCGRSSSRGVLHWGSASTTVTTDPPSSTWNHVFGEPLLVCPARVYWHRGG